MDKDFKPLSALIENLLSFRSEYVDEAAGTRTFITRCEIESPIELDLSRDEEGRIHIGSTPPLYPLTTTISPVFHRVRFVMQPGEDSDDGRK